MSIMIGNHRRRATVGTALGTALLLSACQSAPPRAPDYSRYDPANYPAPTYDQGSQPEQDADADINAYANVSPAAGPAPRAPRQAAAAPRARVATQTPPDDGAGDDAAYPQNTGSMPASSGVQAAEVIKMQERLERVERAMLRLDRRMQLVERNELTRMSGDAPAPTGAQVSQNNQQNSQGDTNPDQLASADAPAFPAATGQYTDGFQPVSTAITSALQAAPRALNQPVQDAATRTASNNTLPSLADGPSGGASENRQAGDPAIWTIRYDSDKVWPDRAELPASRDIVALLREKHGATLFARGNKPNSVEFRERVKALSRYLSKVTSLDSVPIAALAADHLDDDTIEILATP